MLALLDCPLSRGMTALIPILLICPPGAAAKTLSSRRTKNIPLFRNANQLYGPQRSAPTRGVRVVTNVERNAVDVNVP
jgi:hypothetical protein